MTGEVSYGGVKVRAAARRFDHGVDLLVTDDCGRMVGQPIIMQASREGMMQEPTISLHQSAAQQLIDELWAAGLRPSEGTGSAGALRATKHHLEDMRKIALGQLGVGID